MPPRHMNASLVTRPVRPSTLRPKSLGDDQSGMGDLPALRLQQAYRPAFRFDKFKGLFHFNLTRIAVPPDHDPRHFARPIEAGIKVSVQHGHLLTSKPVRDPLPFAFGRHRQQDVVLRFRNDLQPERSHARSACAHTAIEPRSCGSQAIIPTAPMKQPPEAMGVESGAMSASANRFDSVAPRRSFEQVCRNAQAVFCPPRHITAPTGFAWLHLDRRAHLPATRRYAAPIRRRPVPACQHWVR